MGAPKRVPSFSARPGFPSGLRVLLVDSDAAARARTEAQLRECSYEVGRLPGAPACTRQNCSAQARVAASQGLLRGLPRSPCEAAAPLWRSARCPSPAKTPTDPQPTQG
jgi:hypothetical protein